MILVKKSCAIVHNIGHFGWETKVLAFFLEKVFGVNVHCIRTLLLGDTMRLKCQNWIQLASLACLDMVKGSSIQITHFRSHSTCPKP